MKVAVILFGLIFVNSSFADPVTHCDIIAIEHQSEPMLAFRTRTIVANSDPNWNESQAMAQNQSRIEGLRHWPYQHNRGMQHLRDLKQTNDCDLDPSKIRCDLLNGEQETSLSLVHPMTNQEIFEFNRSGGVTYEQMINDFRNVDLCH